MNSNLISALRNMADDIGNIGASPLTVDLTLIQLAIAALEPQWQPIETAPNGQLALFCDMSATELRSSFFVDWVVDRKFCGNRHHTATHWQPLPAAPEATA